MRMPQPLSREISSVQVCSKITLLIYWKQETNFFNEKVYFKRLLKWNSTVPSL